MWGCTCVECGAVGRCALALCVLAVRRVCACAFFFCAKLWVCELGGGSTRECVGAEDTRTLAGMEEGDGDDAVVVGGGSVPIAGWSVSDHARLFAYVQEASAGCRCVCLAALRARARCARLLSRPFSPQVRLAGCRCVCLAPHARARAAPV